MTIGELLYQCDIGYRNTFRKYERLSKKIIESNWSRNFNEICLKVILVGKTSIISLLLFRFSFR